MDSRAERPEERPVEPLLEERGHGIRVRDPLHEEAGFRVDLHFETRDGPVEESEDALERVGECRRRVLHACRLQDAPARPRLARA